ncbi:hypothetical protein [Teredinibacter turnerae]|uniref:hypothetical protein n=1 Tax=Teredinibacter turnerae TaxID=2426 RepID=UPI0003799BFD|nr:hypothetical protein [Teredinibacter turnerae]
MVPDKLNNYGSIVLDVDEAHEQQTREFRAKRDRLYGNIYSERETDERWIGDLGEFAFKSWLNKKASFSMNGLRKMQLGPVNTNSIHSVAAKISLSSDAAPRRLERRLFQMSDKQR